MNWFRRRCNHKWVEVEDRDVAFNAFEYLSKELKISKDEEYSFIRWLREEDNDAVMYFWHSSERLYSVRLTPRMIYPEVCVKCGECRNHNLEDLMKKYWDQYQTHLKEKADEQDLAKKILSDCVKSA